MNTTYTVKHIQKGLTLLSQYSSKSVCEANAREKIAAAVKLFNLMDNADAEKVERGEL